MNYTKQSDIADKSMSPCWDKIHIPRIVLPVHALQQNKEPDERKPVHRKKNDGRLNPTGKWMSEQKIQRSEIA